MNEENIKLKKDLINIINKQPEKYKWIYESISKRLERDIQKDKENTEK